MRMKDEQEKLAARKEISTGKLPEYLQALETLLTQNGSTGETFCSQLAENHTLTL